MFERLRQLISQECSCIPSDEVLDMLLSRAEELHVRANSPVIPYGKLDDSVYILKSGIVRYCYFDGDKEKIWGFACPGTIMISYNCFYMNAPSFFQLEACKEPAAVLRIPKGEFNWMLESSRDFTRWFLQLQFAQLNAYEMKLSIISGSALDRFKALIENRPEIVRGVQQKHIASYLGVTPAYLSRIKNRKF